MTTTNDRTETNDRTDLGLEEYVLRGPTQRVSEAQCECPDFCPVQHDSDN